MPSTGVVSYYSEETHQKQLVPGHCGIVAASMIDIAAVTEAVSHLTVINHVTYQMLTDCQSSCGPHTLPRLPSALCTQNVIRKLTFLHM